MHDIFSLTVFNKFFSLHILRYVLPVLYKKRLVAVMYLWFELKASLGVFCIFNPRSKVNTATGLALCTDFLSNLGYFVFAVGLLLLLQCFV